MYFIRKELDRDLVSYLQELREISATIFEVTVIECPKDFFSRESIDLISDIFKNSLLSLSMNDYLTDYSDLLKGQKFTLRLRPDLNEYYDGEFNSSLLRTHDHKFLSNVDSELRKLDYKNWDRFSLTLEIDEQNIDLLYASIRALDEVDIPLHFFIKVDPSLIKNKKFVEKMKSYFGLLEMYISNKPFIYFYPHDHDEELWNALVENSFCGPERLEIDVSNTCTHNCTFCGIYNDESMEKHKDEDGRLSDPIQSYIDDKISKENFYRILNQAPFGIESVTLGGVGDPLTHPNIMEFIEAIRLKGLIVTIYTNYAYLTPKKIEKLHSLTDERPHGINLILNISGGNVESYLKTRPNQRAEDFIRLKENLSYSNHLYRRDGHGVDMVMMCVVNKDNAFDLPSLVDFATVTGVGSVWFKPMELHDQTLMEKVIREDNFDDYYASLYKAYLKAKKQGLKIHDEHVTVLELEQVKSKIPNYTQGKIFQLEDEIKNSVSKDKPGLGLEINQMEAKRWQAFESRSLKLCHIKRNDEMLNSLENLQDVEFSQQEEEIKLEVRNGDLASKFFSTLPCFIALNYIRFHVNGDITPCCISHFPTGNINENSHFRSAWFSSNAYSFRNKLKNINKDKFHLKEDAWSFCQQCCHLTENIKYNLKRGYKFKDNSGSDV